MKPFPNIAFTCLAILCLLLQFRIARAQDNEQVYVQAKRYLDLNIHALDKYTKRMERTQQQLLRRLKRQEQRLAKKLLRSDSAAYARLKSQPLSFDSISKLALYP